MIRLLLPLALLGAAPLPPDITEAATCTLPQTETEAAFRALPLLSAEDDTEADERGTIYRFGAGIIWGAPTERATLSDYSDTKAGTATQTYESVAWGDYENARIVVLGSFEKTKCDRERGRRCELDLGKAGEWRKTLTFVQLENRRRIAFTCIFSKPG